MKSTKDNAVYIEAVSEQENGYAASGVIDLDAIPVSTDYIILNGSKFIFKDNASEANEVAIGNTAEACVINLMGKVLPAQASYTREGTVITIVYNTIGAIGNSYTVECSYLPNLITTLSGGSDTPEDDWIKTGSTTIRANFDTIIPAHNHPHTQTSIVTLNEITEGELLNVIYSDNTYDTIKLGDVTLESTTEKIDIFDDGHCKANYRFNDNIDDDTGNYDGDSTDDTVFVDSYLGRGVSVIAYLHDISDVIKDDRDFAISINGVCDYYANFYFTVLDSDNHTIFWLSSYSTQCSYINTDGDAVYFNVPKVNGVANIVLSYSASDTAFTLFSGGNEATSASNVGTIDMNSVRLSGNILDHLRIFDRAVTSEEAAILSKEYEDAYLTTIDIPEDPVRVCRNSEVAVGAAMADTVDELVVLPNRYLSIDASTADDGSNLVTTTDVKEGEKLIIDSVEAPVGSVTYDDPLYTVALDNHALTSTPVRACRRGVVEFTKKSSTTTEFVGTNLETGLVKAGDILLLDEIDTVITGVTEEQDEDDGTLRKYTLEYAELASAPLTAGVPSVDTQLHVTSNVYDGTYFNLEYEGIERQGRAFQRKITTEKKDVTILAPLQTQMYRKG